MHNLMGIPFLKGHIDSSFEDPRWQMSGQDNGDRFAIWFLGQEPNGPAVLCLDSPPNRTGAKSPAHSHDSDQVRLIVEGSFRVGAKWYRKGEMRIQQAGKIYGPEVVGPDGCKQVIIFSHREGIRVNYAKEKDRIQYAELNDSIDRALKASRAEAQRLDSLNRS